MWNSANASAENTMARFSPYTRSRESSCFLNNHSSIIGARITTNTMVSHALPDSIISETWFSALPPVSNKASTIPNILPMYIIGTLAAKKPPNWRNRIVNWRVAATGTLRMTSIAIGSATKYCATSDTSMVPNELLTAPRGTNCE